ncbi:hypothetical protein CAEBREN_31350 [Caenorhabditis brenneri]|uniref:Protein AATF n=1 Tax=Caenorhabditis brenneri TaxID=135651 RepID=G0MNS1_CAEBE|nr:hypothetical protein CAEBREN_31350 [Caenorhabditis brenneri]
MGLLDDISKLTKPATELPDLEDDNFDGSSLVKPTGNRSRSAKNFNFEEGKYAGNAVSRKAIFGDISEISGLHGKVDSSDDDDDAGDEEEEVDDEEGEDDDMEAEQNEANIKSFGDSDDDNDMEDEEEVDDDMEDEEEEEEEEEDDDEDDQVSKNGNEEEEESSNLKMTTLSLKDDSDKADKATSVLHQRQVWDDLMYSNIRIHALLNAMNQLPRGESRKNVLKSCDDSTKKSLENAMENMAKLRDLMKTAVGFFDEKKKGKDSDDEEIPSDDEEIPSDFDDEDEEDDEGSGVEDQVASTKNSENSGTSLKSLKKNLDTLDTSIDKFRASTVTKWYNRTKILNSKSINSTDFSVFEKGSVLGQINKVLADEDKLLKKVHTNRSGKSRIGASQDVIASNNDNEIFDDSDFYQVLLKQMLESRNQTNSQDGADMTRSYMELQSIFSNKKKRDVSQLSSKDRRLKYEPIAKLINFYPSKPSVVTWSHESRNELFKSLFS